MLIDPTFLRLLDNATLSDLDSIRDGFATAGFWSTLAVVIGCAMEVPEVMHELWPKLFPTRFERSIKMFSSVGLLFVVLGVAGELTFEHLGSEYEGLIRSINEAVLSDTESRLTDAILTVGDLRISADASARAATQAEAASRTAIASSGEAIANARAAHREADSYARGIASAKQEAANAVSKLANAEQRLADSTQREAAAEEKLSAIKTPRSLVRTKELIDALKPYRGTVFTLDAFMDDESNKFSVVIAAVLKEAGWIRQQPAGINLGIPTMQTVFEPGGKRENVPSCLDTGVGIHLTEKESQSELSSKPISSSSLTLRAAVSLYQVIGSSISPSEEHNVAYGLLDPEPGNESLKICIGRKP